MASSFVIQFNAWDWGVDGSSKREASETVDISSRIWVERSSEERLQGKVGEAVGSTVGSMVVGDGVGTSGSCVGMIPVGGNVATTGGGVEVGGGRAEGWGVSMPPPEGCGVLTGVGGVGEGGVGEGGVGDGGVGGGKDDCNVRVQKPTSSAVMSNSCSEEDSNSLLLCSFLLLLLLIAAPPPPRLALRRFLRRKRD